MLIFSKGLTSTELEQIKNAWKKIIEECSLLINTRAGFIGPNGPVGNSTWIYSDETFQQMRDSFKVVDFQVNRTPTSRQLRDIILNAIESARVDLERESKPPPSAGKQMLILTDLDLALDTADTKDVVTKLNKSQFQVRHVWLPTGNKTSPTNIVNNNMEQIMDPHVSSLYLSNVAELSTVGRVKQLAICYQPYFSLPRTDKYFPEPMPEPEPFMNAIDYFRPPKPPPPPPPPNSNFNWGRLENF